MMIDISDTYQGNLEICRWGCKHGSLDFVENQTKAFNIRDDNLSDAAADAGRRCG
jgi:hypothetical protein